KIFLRAAPRVGHRRRRAEGVFEREQPFEHADRRVERRAHRAALRLAVPAAISQLLAEQPIDEPIAALAEVRAERDDAAVDAGLDFTLEERRVAELRSPRHMVANAIDRGPYSLAGRIDAEVAQEHQRVHVRPPERHGDAVAPLAVGALLVEQARAPSLR